eukprot:TRINITY_DN58996_c0_g1_i1.p1 TRINITY_DN58996_c0_g1~~TRINITY_DN58996_c0_g1_i1.p1  ORF type:complete len:496 (-),score=77.76 TRINITY_DN58996_c0_g1_i1:372-1811(-)
MEAFMSLPGDDGLRSVFENLAQENSLCSEVRNGNFEAVKQMLAKQYDPNSDSDYDLRYMTALERAVDELHAGLVALLFVHGADPINNVYTGEEPDQASCSGFKSLDVRQGFEEAFARGEPIPRFPGLHALLLANSGEPGCKRMRSILFLMEARMTRAWNNKLLKHVRIGFGGSTLARIRARRSCVLLCLRRTLKHVVPQHFATELIAFVMLEEVDVAFQALAQSNLSDSDESINEEMDSFSQDDTIGGRTDLNSRVMVGASSSHTEPVVQDVQHDEQAEVIHPKEAAQINAEMESGFVERIVARNDNDDTLVAAHGGAISDDDFAPFSRLMLLNFSRHPKSFERGLMRDESLREAREALNRAGLSLRLPSGAFVFVDPDEYSAAMVALEGKTTTASDVIVSERLEPVVRAAVASATSHRDNVRVREVHPLGYAGEDPIVVERTFLSVPRAVRSRDSVTNSTTIVHAAANPRRTPCVPIQ